MQLNTNILLIGTGLALCGQAVAGEGSAPATLAGYVAEGLASHPGLKSAYGKYQAALQRVPQAKSLPAPVVSYTHLIEPVQTRTGPQENIFTLSQTIPWMGKLKLRGGIASREAAAAMREYEALRLKLVRDIGAAYYGYASLAKETVITEEILELLDRLGESVDEKVRGGGDYSAKLRLEVEIGKTEDQLKTLERERERRSAEVEVLLGREPGGDALPWPALGEGQISRASAGALRDLVLQRNPRLKALEERIAAAEERVRLARKSPVPDPTIGMNYIQIGDGGKDAVGVSVGFKIPIWFKKYKAERREAEAMEGATRAELSNVEHRLMEEFTKGVEDLTEAADRVELYREKLVPAAREALAVTETGYSAGKATILDLIDSERTLLELQRTYWRAVADTHSSLIRLQTLAGQEQ